MITDSALTDIFNYINSLVNYVAIGTGVLPQNTDSDLDQETTRKLATTTIENLTAIKEIYLDDTEGNGITFSNAGIFFNGANENLSTGDLFAGSGINVVKDNTKSLTISIEITLMEG